MLDFLTQTYVLLSMAAASLATACVALWLVLRNSRKARSQARPFWAGQWPPQPGAVLDARYRFDHLSFDWLLPGESVHVGEGEWIECLGTAPRPSNKSAEKPACSENVDAAVGAHIDAPHASQRLAEPFVRLGSSPYRDTFSGLQYSRQDLLVVPIGVDGHPPQSRFESAIQRPRRGETRVGDRSLQHPDVRYPEPDIAAGQRIQSVGELRRPQAEAPIYADAEPGLQDRPNAELDTVAHDGAPGVDQTEDGAQQRDPESHKQHPRRLIHPVSPNR